MEKVALSSNPSKNILFETFEHEKVVFRPVEV
jgi:hypothetical protein